MQRSCIHFALLHNKLKQTVAENNTHISVSRSYKSEVWTQDDWVLRSGSHSAEIKVLAAMSAKAYVPLPGHSGGSQNSVSCDDQTEVLFPCWLSWGAALYHQRPLKFNAMQPLASSS